MSATTNDSARRAEPSLRYAEKLCQTLDLENFFFGSVGDDSSLAHQHHALNLWNNVRQFMRHQNNRGSRFAKARIVCRKLCCAARSSELQGSSNSNALGLCTSARAIRTRRASPDDISQTGRSARCEIFNSASAASASSFAWDRRCDSDRSPCC